MTLIKEFVGYEFNTDYGGNEKVSRVSISTSVFPTEEEARSFVTRSSYGGNTAYLAAFTTKRLLKGYSNAFANFIAKYNEYTEFNKKLTIGYGRKALRVTCPHCDSSITLKYGGMYKECPVCKSKKIISDSNWKMLETKKRMAERAAENLRKEAEKNDITFICGIEWHC